MRRERGSHHRISKAVTIVATLSGLLLIGLFYTRSGHAPILAFAAVPEFNLYQEVDLSAAGDSERNDRMAISIRSGHVDFIVFYRSTAASEYPNFVGTQLGNEIVVGHIMLSSYTHRIEVTGTRKAYEIRGDQILEYPLKMQPTPQSLLHFLSEIRNDPSIAGLKARRRSARARSH